MTDAYLLIPDTPFFPSHQIIPASTSKLLVNHLTLYAGPTILDFSSWLPMQAEGIDFGLHQNAVVFVSHLAHPMGLQQLWYK